MKEVILGILFGTGAYLVIADLIHLPEYRTVSTMSSFIRKTDRKESLLNRMLAGVSVFLSGKLRLNEYKRIQMLADITAAGLTITPERFMMDCLVKTGFIAILSVPFLFVFPVLSPVILVLAAAVYSKESRSISGRIKQKRSEIESELPRLVATIEKTLQHNRDVLSILENYQANAGKSFSEELAVTIADMRSGNYEIALTRLESRVGSSLMSDVTRGLIGVIRGDETDSYWTTLAYKFSDYQRQLLKAKAASVPRKVRRLSVFLLICFMLIYVVVIGSTLMGSLGSLLG